VIKKEPEIFLLFLAPGERRKCYNRHKVNQWVIVMMNELEILEKLLNPYKAVLDEPRCLKSRHKAMTCDRCVTVCPRQAITPGKPLRIVSEACTGCGLCVPVCPTGALSLRGLAYSRFLGRVKTEGTVVLGCGESGGGADALLVPCLAFLSPEVLAAATLKNADLTVDFDEKRCQNCELGAKDKVMATLEGARSWLESLGVNGPRILPGATNRQKTISRREFFGFFKKRAAEKAVEILAEEETPRHPLREKFLHEGRALFFRRVRQAWEKGRAGSSQRRPVLPKVEITSNCHLCRDCSLFCPTGALERRESETTFQLRFDPELCLACGLCALVCRQKALNVTREEVSWEALLAGEKRLLIEKEHRQCQSCGRNFVAVEEETICPDCQWKLSRESLWQELLPVSEPEEPVAAPEDKVEPNEQEQRKE